MHFFRRQNDARVGGVYAIDVGINLADVGFNRSSDGDGGEIGTATTEGGDLAIGGDALESGDDDDFTFIEAFGDIATGDFDNTGASVNGVGNNSGLGASA